MNKTKTYPLAHAQSELVVGEMYSVCHAKLTYDNERVHYVPILPLLHKDEQFGVDYLHYHIDGRFSMSKFMKHEFRLENGRTNRIVSLPGHVRGWMQVPHISLEVIYRNKKCISLETGIRPPRKEVKQDKADYHAWYNSMIGKSCAGKKCPHLGTTMISKNGVLVCPMHNLIGCIEKEIIIPYKII